MGKRNRQNKKNQDMSHLTHEEFLTTEPVVIKQENTMGKKSKKGATSASKEASVKLETSMYKGEELTPKSKEHKKQTMNELAKTKQGAHYNLMKEITERPESRTELKEKAAKRRLDLVDERVEKQRQTIVNEITPDRSGGNKMVEILHPNEKKIVESLQKALKDMEASIPKSGNGKPEIDVIKKTIGFINEKLDMHAKGQLTKDGLVMACKGIINHENFKQLQKPGTIFEKIHHAIVTAVNALIHYFKPEKPGLFSRLDMKKPVNEFAKSVEAISGITQVLRKTSNLEQANVRLDALRKDAMTEKEIELRIKPLFDK